MYANTYMHVHDCGLNPVEISHMTSLINGLPFALVDFHMYIHTSLSITNSHRKSLHIIEPYTEDSSREKSCSRLPT